MFNFLKHKKFYFIVSAVLLVPSVISLVLFKLRPSIDFTGGTVLELKFKENPNFQFSIFKEVLGDGEQELVSIQSSGESSYLLRFKPIDEGKKEEVVGALKEEFGEVEVARFETVGPTLGKELLTKTLIAVVFATLGILGYVAWQFKNRMYGICAILAMFHDTIILLGSFSLLGHFFGVEVDTLFVTAVLTTLSLSVHDTVVVFNSIREAAGSSRPSSVDRGQFESIVNQAINSTIVRSLNNSFTIIFMLLCLILLGGETIRWFAVALLIGTILGTYSSTFIASPLLLIWQRYANRNT